MKKNIVLILCIALAATSRAQIQLGVKGGLNLSKFTTAYSEKYKSKAGFYIGGQANIPVTADLSIQPELVYSGQGGRWNDDGDKSIANYINVPVLAKYTFNKKFFAEAGPQVGFLIKATDKYDGKSENVKEYVKSTDFTFAFGAGYKIDPNLSVNIRYNLGLSSYYGAEKNRVFQLGISYMFNKSL